jgi:hypothetical protein
MTNTFTVRTKSGKEYTVRLKEITPSRNNKLGTEGSWDMAAEIEVNGTWYRCFATHTNQSGNLVKTVRVLDKQAQIALGIPENLAGKNDVHICATTDWHPIYQEMLKNANESFSEKANAAVFTKIRVTYHTSYKYSITGWDSDTDSDYIRYNNQLNSLLKSLKHIDTEKLQKYQTGTDMGDYSIEYYFEIPVSDIDLIQDFALPGLEQAEAEKVKAEESSKKQAIKKANIGAGCVYFHCESAPHDEDLTGVILTRPAPQGGTFTVEHRLSEEMFSRIKKYGRYYSADFLEECDMFYSAPGWRVVKEAIEELLKSNRVFVNDVEIVK